MPGAKSHLVLNPATKLISSLLPDYSSSLWLRLVVGSPIFPGQTLVFRWESDRVGFTPPDLGAAASISLQFVDDFGNLDPNGILYKSPLSNSDLDAVVSQHGFSSQIIEAQLTDEMAKRLSFIRFFMTLLQFH